MIFVVKGSYENPKTSHILDAFVSEQAAREYIASLSYDEETKQIGGFDYVDYEFVNLWK